MAAICGLWQFHELADRTEADNAVATIAELYSDSGFDVGRAARARKRPNCFNWRLRRRSKNRKYTFSGRAPGVRRYFVPGLGGVQRVSG